MFGLKLVRTNDIRALREEMTLYKRSLEDLGWTNLSLNDSNKVFPEGLSKVLEVCKRFYYLNPLAGHWVHLTTHFVFGDGLPKPRSDEPTVQEVIDEFWSDPDNLLSMTQFLSQQMLSNKIQYEGNVFFVLFTDEEGVTRIRIINADEVDDIIKDENDRSRTIFYKVRRSTRRYDFSSGTYTIDPINSFVFYPDVNCPIEEYQGRIPSNKLSEDRIYHVKVNCDINDKFGVPELYRAVDWMRAHRDMAADMATLVKSLSTLAWKKKVKGSPTQVNALKNALQAKTDLTNMRATAGSTQYENEGVDTTPFNTPTGGVKIGSDGLKQMQLMVCAASDIFYHYYGDPETGNLATTTSMELPMIKKFSAYQMIWKGVINDILQCVIDNKIRLGRLDGSVEYNPKTRRDVITTKLDRNIRLDFPPIIEKDVKILVDSLKVARDNKMVSTKTAATQFVSALGINDTEEEVKNIKDIDEITPPSSGLFGSPVSKDPEPIPAKETIEAPAVDKAARLAKKNNYVMQRMGGYRKSLTSNFSVMVRRMKASAAGSGDSGKYVGDIPDKDKHLDSFRKDMLKSADEFFPIAVGIGSKFFQSHLPKMKVMESLYEAKGIGKTYLQKKLDWNTKYVTESLMPDLAKALDKVVKSSYESEKAFISAISEALASFEGRVEQYVGAFWRVEEGAIKAAGEGTGMKVNFVGADDQSTCEGCNEAMAGNPWDIDEVPEPGSHECNGRCRHALQIVEGV